MRIVLALGGNALLHRGEALTAENQLINIKRAVQPISELALYNQLIITHGNGPQVGLLALQGDAYKSVKSYPLDVLSAETEGMIGYLLEQELVNVLPRTRTVTTLLTRVVVDKNDPAFKTPTKPIGPMYSKEEAILLAKERGWTVAPDNNGYRRVVASPKPIHILGIAPILWLLERESIVIAAGGGGIPVVFSDEHYSGIEAVIDKDFCSALLAREIKADCLIIGTDVDAVYLDWGQATQRAISEISVNEIQSYTFSEGSMAPKVKAACEFVSSTGKKAFIGSLNQIDSILKGHSGTCIHS